MLSCAFFCVSIGVTLNSADVDAYEHRCLTMFGLVGIGGVFTNGYETVETNKMKV